MAHKVRIGLILGPQTTGKVFYRNGQTIRTLSIGVSSDRLYREHLCSVALMSRLAMFIVQGVATAELKLRRRQCPVMRRGPCCDPIAVAVRAQPLQFAPGVASDGAPDGAPSVTWVHGELDPKQWGMLSQRAMPKRKWWLNDWSLVEQLLRQAVAHHYRTPELAAVPSADLAATDPARNVHA